MHNGDERHGAYVFGEFTLDLDRGTLQHKDVDVGLRPKSFAVLTELVAHSGHLVSKEALLAAVWGHTYVTEGALAQCLIDIRRVLGDQTRELIRTVPRRGFIFDLPVTHRDGGPDGSTAAAQDAAPEVAATQDRVGAAGVPRLRGAIAAAGAVLIVAVAWWGAAELGFELPFADRGGSAAPPDSIAVLPLLDMSPGRDNEYFADGLSEELLDALSQIPGLRVIARTSSFFFKGRNADIPTVAKKLHVTHVLEGSVRRSGDTVRITVQLVDTRSNAHLWSKTYDRELRDIFAIQEEVAVAVADALQLTLSQQGAGAIAPPLDPRAHEEYLQGRFLWNRRGPGDAKSAGEHYRRAVTIDPAFARAWVGLASVSYVLQENDMMRIGSRDLDWVKEFRDMLERALEIDPYLAEAHARISTYYYLVGDRPKAEEHWAKAQTLDPDSQLVLGGAAGEALMRDQYDEAVSLYRRVLELDPLSAIHHGNLGAFLLAAGRLEEAQKEKRAALEISPQLYGDAEQLALIAILQGRYDAALAMIEKQQPGAQQDELLALAYSGLGRQDEAAAAFKRLQAKDDLDAVFRQAEVHAFRGESDRAFQLLQSIHDRLYPGTFWTPDLQYMWSIRMSPLFIPLRGDPRWQALWKNWEKWM